MLMHKLIRIHNLFLLALSFAIDQIAHILSVKQKVWQARLVFGHLEAARENKDGGEIGGGRTNYCNRFGCNQI